MDIGKITIDVGTGIGICSRSESGGRKQWNDKKTKYKGMKQKRSVSK